MKSIDKFLKIDTEIIEHVIITSVEKAIIEEIMVRENTGATRIATLKFRIGDWNILIDGGKILKK